MKRRKERTVAVRGFCGAAALLLLAPVLGGCATVEAGKECRGAVRALVMEYGDYVRTEALYANRELEAAALVGGAGAVYGVSTRQIRAEWLQMRDASLEAAAEARREALKGVQIACTGITPESFRSVSCEIAERIRGRMSEHPAEDADAPEEEEMKGANAAAHAACYTEGGLLAGWE